MTSIPASRSARAMILAPRSWPSRPGLATTTRILRVSVLLTRAASLWHPNRLADSDRERHVGVHGARDLVGALPGQPLAVGPRRLGDRAEQQQPRGGGDD